MKKLIIATAIMASLTSFAIDKLNKNSTEAEYREVFNELMTCKPNLIGVEANKKGFWSITSRHDLDALRTEFDEKLANSGRAAPPQCTISWPKASEVGRRIHGWDTNFPVRVSIARRLNCDANYMGIIHNGATYEDLVSCLAEISVSPKVVFQSEIDFVKNAIRDRAEKIIKRKMRQAGISFVVKDGVNPVAQRLQSLTTALNAPRLAGLNEWNAELKIDAPRVNVMKDISDSDVQKLKDSIFYGDKNMDVRSQNTLFFCLGVDGYNAFVREYNGDK